MSLSLSWVDSSAHARATSACVAALISSTTYLRLAPAPITHNNYTQVRQNFSACLPSSHGASVA